MIKLRSYFIFFFALVVSSANASEASHNPTWQVIGTGQLSCGKWSAARQSQDLVQVELYKQWVVGWIVAYNYYEAGQTKKRYVDTPDFDVVSAFLDKFCADHPLTPVALGAAELVQQLGGAKAFHNRNNKK